jgi:hypothetical protein
MAEKKNTSLSKNNEKQRTVTRTEESLEAVFAQIDNTTPALSEKHIDRYFDMRESTIQAIKEDHTGDRDLQKHSQVIGLISLGAVICFLLVLCVIIAIAKPELLDKILGYIFSFIGGAGFGGVGVSIYKSNQSKR